MKQIAVVNSKGGVGKTLIATNLAYVLSEKGHKTQFVDFASTAKTPLEPSEQLTISRELSGADAFDYVVIDTPPRADDALLENLKGVDLVIVPTTPEPASLLGALKSISAIHLTSSADFLLVTNQTVGPAAALKLANRVRHYCEQQLSATLWAIATLHHDPALPDLAVRRQLVAATKPKSKTTAAIENLATLVKGHEAQSLSLAFLPSLRVQPQAQTDKAA